MTNNFSYIKIFPIQNILEINQMTKKTVREINPAPKKTFILDILKAYSVQTNITSFSKEQSYGYVNARLFVLTVTKI